MQGKYTPKFSVTVDSSRFFLERGDLILFGAFGWNGVKFLFAYLPVLARNPSSLK